MSVGDHKNCKSERASCLKGEWENRRTKPLILFFVVSAGLGVWQKEQAQFLTEVSLINVE